MKIIDLTREIDVTTQVFPLYPKVSIIKLYRHETHGFEAELMIFVTHTSTHVDAPRHFIRNGLTIDKFPLSKSITNAYCISIIEVRDINRKILEQKLKEVNFEKGCSLLIYTGWSRYYGTDKYLSSDSPGLTEDAAQLLVEYNVPIIGIDTPSIDPGYSTDFKAHKLLLSNGIFIIENLTNLEQLVNKRFKLIVTPLKIINASASPARIFAVLED